MSTAAAPRTLVVGAALLDRGRVLAARRVDPPSAAGRWEFPGGKVEDGEDAESALVRELREELGCEVEVATWLRGEAWIKSGYRLRVALCRIVAGQPVALEHDALRWLGPDDLDEVSWLDPDRPFLRELREALRRDQPGTPARPGL